MPPGNVRGFGDDAAELGIDHLVVAQVNPTVGDVVGAGPKEDQVAGLGVLSAHVRVGVVLFLRRPWQSLADCLVEDVLREAGAVKGTRAIATVNVRLAQLRFSRLQDGRVSAVTGCGRATGRGVGVALLLQVAVPDPTGSRLTAVGDVIVEVLDAVLLDNVTLLGGVPSRVRIIL